MFNGQITLNLYTLIGFLTNGVPDPGHDPLKPALPEG